MKAATADEAPHGFAADGSGGCILGDEDVGIEDCCANRRDAEGEEMAPPPFEAAPLVAETATPPGAASGGRRLSMGGVGAGVNDSPKE